MRGLRQLRQAWHQVTATPPADRVNRYRRDAWDRVRHFARRQVLENPAARRLFESHLPVLTDGQARVVADLNRCGVSTISFRELFGDPNRWEALTQTVAAFAEGEAVRAGIAAYEHSRDTDIWNFRKEFIVRTPVDKPKRADDPWLRLGVAAPILDVVNSYLGLWSRLIYQSLWYTIPTPAARPPVASQRWHRDPEDHQLVKVFLYFTDVDDGAGPLQYIPGTTANGPYEHLWRRSSPTDPFYPSVYPEPIAVERQFPSSEWVTCTGPAGTLVFCDTRGLHRGGFATRRHRILATWVYVSPASLFARRFVVQGDLPEGELSDAARFALN